MGLTKTQLVAALSPQLPRDIVEGLFGEYIAIKQHLAFRRFQPSELNGGRFAEYVIRLLQFALGETPTPVGAYFGSGVPEKVCNKVKTDTSLPESMRFIITRLTETLLIVRNKRDVGHPGGDVNPNLADSLLVAHMADWVLTETLRIYYAGDINTAQEIADSLNEIQIPIVAEVDNFVRVLDTSLKFSDKTLVIMYHKYPSKIKDTILFKWAGYSSISAYKKNVLQPLHSGAYIHYFDGCCSLLPKGVAHVENHISMELVV